jgi:hypothetical protein
MPDSSNLSVVNLPVSQSTPEPLNDLTGLLDQLTHAAATQLGLVTESPSILGTVFYLGDGLQRAVADGIFDLFQPATWSPVNLLHLSSEAIRQTIQLTRLLDPEQARLAWQELRNKLEIFLLVKNLPAKLGLPPGQFVPLPALVEKAYSLSPFEALWAVEGVGHYYTDMYWKKKGVPSGLLSEAQALVPSKSLLMLHAGMGLAFADRLLDTLEPDVPSESQTAAVLKQFISLCENNARPGYVGAAIESLGIVTRDFYQDSMDVVQRQFQEIAPQLAGFFWHGVGRGFYFSREHFLPVLSSASSSVEEEVHNCADRKSAMAGLAWAVTVVNMRQPAIMENILRRQTGQLSLADAFTNGVISSVIMRQDTTPDAQFADVFNQYQTNDRQLAAAWERLISRPIRAALQTDYPVLRERGALDQVFRYQDMPALVAYLKYRNPAAKPDEFVYQN